MLNFSQMFAQANQASGDAEVVFGFLVIAGLLVAILSACKKKKEYDVHIQGKIKQR
ncbi:MAG: hypothetical protein KDA84_07295 [Planctomycetaceae bacterium]|nr:hypothetical protein [Planctomycetaceae bacterium]